MATSNGRDGRQARPVNWSEWRHAHAVRLWEAVALSMNIEPTQVRLDPGGWMAGPGSVIAKEGAEFDMRLRMASRALVHQLDVAVMSRTREGCHIVLRQFAAWVRDVEWKEVPSELVELAGPRAAEPNELVSGPQVSSEPVPLSTGDMASLLGGLDDRTESGWLDMLADCPKWLMGARVSRGAPGRRTPAAWNPVSVALAVQSRGVPATKLRPIFKHRLAAHWADEWARVNQAADDYEI